MAASLDHTKPGTIIGRPYEGTHAKAFNVSGGSDNWQSENAVDVWLHAGTAVTAIADGVVSPGGWGYGQSASGGRFAGERFHLVIEPTNPPYVCFYTHLSKLIVARGHKVKAGQIIGYSGIANGVPHLHFAVQPPFNPADYVRAAYRLSQHQPTSPPGNVTGPGPAAGPVSSDVEDAWHQLMRAFGFTWPDATAHIKDTRGRIRNAVN